MLVNMLKTVTTQDRAMRHTVIYSPQSICTVSSLHEKQIPCIIITVLKPVVSQTEMQFTRSIQRYYFI